VRKRDRLTLTLCVRSPSTEYMIYKSDVSLFKLNLNYSKQKYLIKIIDLSHSCGKKSFVVTLIV